jgi:DivIVA domain-containing protein
VLQPEFTVRRTGDRYDRADVDALVEQQRPRFSTVRLRMGYDAEQVDEFIDRVMATVNGQPVQRPVTADEIRNIAFSSVWMREGYHVAQVDMFLDQAEDWLRSS